MIKTLSSLLFATGIALSAVPASATIFGSNLIVNGDAENGTGSAGGGVVPVANFATTGDFTIVAYNEGGGFPVTGDPGVSAGGKNFFAGGTNAAFSSGFQSIDLSSGSAFIDGGTSVFALSAYLGGFSSQRDNAVLTLDFLDATNSTLGSFSLGPVSTADRGSHTGLLFRDTSGFVPIGARTAAVTLKMFRVDGTYNDGYADNLSLVLTGGDPLAAPEPATWAMMVAGFGIAGVSLRRRRKISASFA